MAKTNYVDNGYKVWIAFFISLMLLFTINYSVKHITDAYYNAQSVSLILDCSVSGIAERKILQFNLVGDATINGTEVKDAVVDAGLKSAIPENIACTITGQMPVKLAQNMMEGLNDEK